MIFFSTKGVNGDRDTLSRGGKERSSRRSIKSVKEKDAAGKENIESKESVEKREKKILHRLEKIERTEKVIIRIYHINPKLNLSFKINVSSLRKDL